MNRLSFVIPNFNYGRFVGQAIDSALAVEWPDVEVIVVDDGSTDDSAEVIAGYGDRIRFIRQPNSGPRVACNTGFAESTGDVVVFLDSDDVVTPDLAREVDEAMTAATSKVQYQLNRINAAGEQIGQAFPAYPDPTPTPTQLTEWLLQTGAYPTPPGSGNAYARWFIEELFPLDGSCGDATDSALLAAAPILGEVATVARPLGGYRLHGENRSFLLSDVDRFGRQIERAQQRQELCVRLAGERGLSAAGGSIFRGRHLLQLRIAQLRLQGRSTIKGDGRGRMLHDAVSNAFAPGPESFKDRLLIAGWCTVALLAPARLAARLVQARFAQHAQPFSVSFFAPPFFFGSRRAAAKAKEKSEQFANAA